MIDVFALNNILSESQTVKNLYKGDCKGCGECCSRILPMSQHDIERLQKYVKRYHVEQTPDRGDIDMLCPYLTENKECAVYHARPDICRAYRCDDQVNKNFKPFMKYMTHHPYEICDMRKIEQ